MQDTPPIACTLAPGDLKERLSWIARLNEDALLRHERRDLTLILVYALDAADRVQELVKREQTCCAFMSFHIEETPDEIRLTITSPEEAREATDVLFEQFVPGGTAQSTCGCSSQTNSSIASVDKSRSRRNVNAAGVAALTLSTGAVACGACCILPLALPAVVLAGGGSLLAVMTSAHSLVTTLAIIAVVVAWTWVAWIGLRLRMWPAISTLLLMVTASAVLVIALIWPSIEGKLMQAFIT
jgi:hypothetical protein